MHLVLVDLRDVRARRQAGRGPPARHRHHRQPQRRAIRPAPADGPSRPAHRHAGAGHARVRRRGLRRGRSDHRDRADARVRRAPRRARRAASARSPSATRSYAHLGEPRPSARPRAGACGRPVRRRACDAFARPMNELDALYAFLVAAVVAALLTPLTMRLASARGRDRRAARARALGAPDAAAGRPGDLRRSARRGRCCAARATPRPNVIAGRRRVITAGRRARRPLRAAAGGQARRADRGGGDRRALGVAVKAITLPFIGHLAFPDAPAGRADRDRARR